MSTATPAKTQPNEITPQQQFRRTTERIAFSLLRDWVGDERAKEATGRIAVAVAASAAAARDPKEFYKCTTESVATCIAIAALTGIMPSTGATALAYLIPQPPRKNEPPILQYMLSHRGLNALARRCGQVMVPVPIGYKDEIKVDDFGLFQVVSRDIDDPPTTFEELRGVIVVVREISTGLVNATGFVPKKLIEQRKAVSRSAKSQYSPWTNWYVEMAMKTAMHYAISRGWCVIDDTEAVRALSSESDADLVPANDQDYIEGRVTGTAGLRQKLGIDGESEPRSEEQPTAENNGGEITDTEADIRSDLEKATSTAALNSVRSRVMEADLPQGTKSELIESIGEKLAIIEESNE